MVGLWSYAMEKVAAIVCEVLALSVWVPVWQVAWAVWRHLAYLDYCAALVSSQCLGTAMGQSVLVLDSFFSRWQVRQCQS